MAVRIHNTETAHRIHHILGAPSLPALVAFEIHFGVHDRVVLRIIIWLRAPLIQYEESAFLCKLLTECFYTSMQVWS